MYIPFKKYLRINACFLSLYQVELFHHYNYDSYDSYDSFLNVMKNTEKKIYNYIYNYNRYKGCFMPESALKN